MYEHLTYEELLKRKLERVPSDVDKREGSIIQDALAPNAYESKQMYIAADVVLNETYADTASRPYLIRRAAERGIVPYPATYAILKGEFDIEIPIGTRFNLEELNYVVIERIENYNYKLQCETIGAIGNRYFGNLIPIDEKGIENLKMAKLTELLVPGEDEEDTEAFRKRYYKSFESLAFGGNVADYKDRAHKIQGLGGVKIYPVWHGGGTVKLVILSLADGQIPAYQVPTVEFVNEVQEIVDPEANHGQGLGTAPVGHYVTVVGVTPSIINIETTIIYESGFTWADVQESVRATIDKYFDEVNKTWEDSEYLVVRLTHLETRLLDVSGIIDVTHTKLNGAEENLQLGADCIAVRGTVSAT